MGATRWSLCLIVIAALQGACGPRTMEARLRDAERHADKASSHLDDAQRAMEALEPDDMQEALEKAKQRLSEPDVELHPETGMHQDRYKELAAKYPQVRAEREKRDLQRQLEAARERIVPRVQALLEAQEALTLQSPTRAQVDAVTSQAEKLRDALDDAKGLLEKDADFAAWARSQRGKVDRALDAAAKGRKALAVVEGPGKAWLDAQRLQGELKRKKAPADKEPLLRELVQRLADCDKQATALGTEPSAVVLGGGKPQTAAQLLAACKAAQKPAEAELKKAREAIEKAKPKPPPPAKKKGK